MARGVAMISTAVLAGLGIAQFVPVSRENPATRTMPEAPEPAARVLRNACYDCHSNETRWPWYSSFAPVSWLVARDVSVGRAHLNFSEWPVASPEQEENLLRKAAREVGEREMPPALYELAHPQARLSAADRRALMEWFSSHPVARDPSVTPARSRSIGISNEDVD